MASCTTNCARRAANKQGQLAQREISPFMWPLSSELRGAPGIGKAVLLFLLREEREREGAHRECFDLAVRQGKSRTCCIIPPIIPRCPETQSAFLFIHTLAPQAPPRVEPAFPLFLWIRVRRGMLTRMVTVSGHRGPGALKPLHRCTTRANPTSGHLTSK